MTQEDARRFVAGLSHADAAMILYEIAERLAVGELLMAPGPAVVREEAPPPPFSGALPTPGERPTRQECEEALSYATTVNQGSTFVASVRAYFEQNGYLTWKQVRALRNTRPNGFHQRTMNYRAEPDPYHCIEHFEDIGNPSDYGDHS